MIRRIGVEFLEEILKIERRSFSEPWTRGMFESEFGQPYTQVWGSFDEAGKELFGYLVGWTLMDEFHIGDLAVRPDRRRSGIGRGLLDYSLQRACEGSSVRSLLEVRASNEAAVRLYRSAGFSLVATRKNYYRFPTEDALVLQKRLKVETGEQVSISPGPNGARSI